MLLWIQAVRCCVYKDHHWTPCPELVKPPLPLTTSSCQICYVLTKVSWVLAVLCNHKGIMIKIPVRISSILGLWKILLLLKAGRVKIEFLMGIYLQRNNFNILIAHCRSPWMWSWCLMIVTNPGWYRGSGYLFHIWQGTHWAPGLQLLKCNSNQKLTMPEYFLKAMISDITVMANAELQ